MRVWMLKCSQKYLFCSTTKFTSFSVQVNFENPDLSKFPRFSEIRGMEVSLEPDEVLYIPNYWWHYIESESHR